MIIIINKWSSVYLLRDLMPLPSEEHSHNPLWPRIADSVFHNNINLNNFHRTCYAVLRNFFHHFLFK